MSVILLDSPTQAVIRRAGIVRATDRCALDDSGLFHPLGLTFFWALYGWKFERERIIQHLEWINGFGFDYLRILGEVDWNDRSIEPFAWSDYQQILAEFIDCAYDIYNLRTQLTIVGGTYRPGQEQLIPPVMLGREHKIIHYEICNEWTRSDKMDTEDMIRVGRYMRNYTPNLVMLSRPDSEAGGYSQMQNYTERADANMYGIHPRRSDHDYFWSAVRQGYDCKEFPKIISINEPQGPQSSVEELSNPMQLAMARATGVICGGAFYVLHVGQGVTGKADPAHQRPENMWEVPGIEKIMKTVRGIDVALPQTIENWNVRNNHWSGHPMPLNPKIGQGFWEGSSDGTVNKNYATVIGSKFVEGLLGVKPENAMVGKVINDSHIIAYNAETLETTEINVKAGEEVYLPGRSDTMMGYVLTGNV